MMDKSDQVSLESISTKIGDGLHGTPNYDDNGDYFFINGNNLSNGKIVIYEATNKISKSEFKKIEKELSDRTILLGINGTIGNIAYYNFEKVALGKSACYINVKPSVDKNYIRYVLEDNHFQKYAVLYATGSTIKNLGLKSIRNYKFNLPSLPTQQKIASILSAYDDLIENNLKRIKLLEEMAQQTYEEWFVRMRFPGYEDVVNDEESGLPKGWERVTLNEVTTKIGDGLHGTPIYDDNGVYYFVNGNNLENGKIVIKSDTKKISEIEFKKIKKTLNDRTILVAINGTLGNIGLYSGEKIALGKSACYINIAKDVSKLYVRYVLENQHFQSYAYLYATGSTIKNLGLKAIRNYQLNLPPIDAQDSSQSILFQFDNIVEPNYLLIKNIQNQNHRLKEARDILLPRLMSGIIEV
jgi:type I restriction enzyme S subunit